MAERIAEVPRRRLFNRKFGYPDGTPKVDRYFRSAGSKRAWISQDLEELRSAELRGSGWLHAEAIAAAAMHGYMATVMADPRQTQARNAARSMVALVAHRWQHRGDISEWDYRKIRHHMAKPTGPHGRVSLAEAWLVLYDELREAADQPCGFQIVGEDAPPGDPFCKKSPAMQMETEDVLCLLNSDLLDAGMLPSAADGCGVSRQISNVYRRGNSFHEVSGGMCTATDTQEGRCEGKERMGPLCEYPH
jgi:hypothetical protein